MAKVPARSASKIENGKRRIAVDRIKKGGVVLTHIAVSRAIPERCGEAVVIGDGQLRLAICHTRSLLFHHITFVSFKTPFPAMVLVLMRMPPSARRCWTCQTAFGRHATVSAQS